MSIGSQLQSITVLVASECDLTARALESALAADGYVVDRARSGREALDAVRTRAPNAVIVDAHMPDMRGVDVCRELRGDSHGAGATPVILVNAAGDRRSDRLAAFGAGAWEVCPRPVDGTLLLLKLQTFVHAQHATVRLGTTSLLDAETGVYNLAGLLVRARELQALASRRGEPVACVAFEVQRAAPDDAAADRGPAPSPVEIVQFCRTRLRASDTLGRTGPHAFAILAPETDHEGAAHLTLRLRSALDDLSDGWPSGLAPLRIVCTAVADCAEPDASVVDALLQGIRDVAAARAGWPSRPLAHTVLGLASPAVSELPVS